MDRKTSLFSLGVAAFAALVSIAPAEAQSTYDDTQQLLAQIQTDKRAVVLKNLALDDAQLREFTPLFDAYQADRRKLMERSVDLVNAYASNYESMTDDAAKKLLKDWFKLQEDEEALLKKYTKKLERVLPATKVLRWVQLENKLNTLLRLPALRNVPLAQ